MYYYKCILLLIFVMHSTMVEGQDPHYISIGKPNGLPANTFYDVFQDNKGFIWLAHDDGLSRYDGYECKTYGLTKQNSRSGTNIQEDRYGRIWYQNFDGFLFYILKDSMYALQQHSPLGYLEYGVGYASLYVMQKQGLDVYDLNTLKIKYSIKIQETLDIDPRTIISTVFSCGVYYIFTANFLLCFDEHGLLYKITHPEEVDKYKLSYMVASKNGVVMMSKANEQESVFECNVKGEYKLKFKQEIDASSIQGFYCTNDEYWFCTPQGAFLFDKKGKLLNNNKAMFSDKNITAVLKDREDNFWFATKNDGLIFVPDLAAKVFFPEMPAFRIQQFDSLFYLGTLEGELFEANLNNFSLKPIYKSPSRHEISVLHYEKPQQTLWVSAKNFLFLEKNGKLQQEWAAAVKSVQKIDKKYHAIALTGTFGLKQMGASNIKSEWDAIHNKYIDLEFINSTAMFLHSQFVVGVRARSVLYNETSKSIYFATGNGLFKAKPDTLYELKQGDSSIFFKKIILFDEFVYGLSPSGALYVVDANDKLSPFQKNAELSEKRIKDFKREGDLLFLLTNEELLFVNLKDPKAKVKKVYLHSTEINDFLLWDNQILLATSRGILLQQFTDTISQKGMARLCFNNIKVNNQLVKFLDKGLDLKHYQNNIEINYSILSFKTDARFPLYYQINNDAWEAAPTETRLLKLAALSPGQYRIRFRLGSPNDEHYAIQEIKFRILFPWWQQWWFLGLCTLLVTATVYAYYRQQTGMLIRQNKLLSEKIKLEQDLSRSTLKAIKSQMNPHFFYNALNTIQAYIFTDDKRNAINHLSKFSKLTRTILDMSESDKISLEEEIKALNLYLDLEQARFEDDEFQFEIDIAKDLETHELQLPPMLIQPYIENAIKHGLLHKNGNKFLKISFKKEANYLVVKIEDNGIGRIRSAEINLGKKDGHKSFSSEANQKRLELLNKSSNINATIAIADKHDTEGNASGTIVLLKLPID